MSKQTAKEKAAQIYSDCEDCMIELNGDEWGKCVKRCALIAVDEIIRANPHSNPFNTDVSSTMAYWNEVRKEIENL